LYISIKSTRFGQALNPARPGRCEKPATADKGDRRRLLLCNYVGVRHRREHAPSNPATTVNDRCVDPEVGVLPLITAPPRKFTAWPAWAHPWLIRPWTPIWDSLIRNSSVCLRKDNMALASLKCDTAVDSCRSRHALHCMTGLVSGTDVNGC